MTKSICFATDGTPGVRGYQAVRDFYEAGVMTKMTGDTMLIAPPFVSTEADLDRMFELIRGVPSKY